MAKHLLEPAGSPDRSGCANREAEAHQALGSQITGLVGATLILTLAAICESALLRQVALAGFLFNLIVLLPLHPFSGARLFPGLHWPTGNERTEALRFRFSVAFDRQIRRAGRRLKLETADAPGPLARLVGPVMLALIAGGFVLVCIVAVLASPMLLAGAILVWILALFALVLMVAMLDSRLFDRHKKALLLPRRARSPQPPAVTTVATQPWSNRNCARAALASYLLLAASASLGALAAWSGLHT